MKLEDGKFFGIIGEKKERDGKETYRELSAQMSPQISIKCFSHYEFGNMDS
jgi:hypothetical protein